MLCNTDNCMDNKTRLLIWDTIAMAWTEVGLEDEDYPRIAKQLIATGLSWQQIERIAMEDVCGAFAVDSFLIMPCMLWMLMPDWGYSDEFLLARIKKWHSKPRWQQFLNPFRCFGYPIARAMSFSVRRQLKRAYLQRAVDGSG